MQRTARAIQNARTASSGVIETMGIFKPPADNLGNLPGGHALFGDRVIAWRRSAFSSTSQ